MHIRTRKLLGTVALLALVTIWALLAMAFAQFALCLLYTSDAADEL